MSTRDVNITLLKGAGDAYFITLDRPLRFVSVASPDQVKWMFKVDVPGAEHPSPAQAEIVFADSPFLADASGRYFVYEGAPTYTFFVDDDSVGRDPTDVEFYKYSIAVTTPEGGLVTLDPHVIVRRRALRGNEN